MTIYDLSHPITEHMPVYPGTEAPVMECGCSIEDAGFAEKKITFFSHTGTHIDAPAHLLQGGRTLDRFPPDTFMGPALRIPVRHGAPTIEKDMLQPFKEQLAVVDFILLQTGWSRYWGEKAYFDGFPVFSLEAAAWLAGLGLKGIGLDTISADAPQSQDFPIHKAFLKQDMVIIENLTNLSALPRDRCIFSCLPLPFADADGSPVRAVAWVE